MPPAVALVAACSSVARAAVTPWLLSLEPPLQHGPSQPTSCLIQARLTCRTLEYGKVTALDMQDISQPL